MAKRKNSKKTVELISKIIYFLLIIISIVIFGIVLNLKVLPAKYMIPLLLVYSLICIGIGFLIFKKKIKIWIKITTDVVCSIIIILLCFGFYYLNSTMNFMDKIMSKDYQLEEYYVVVLKDAGYKKVSELENKKMSTYKTDSAKYFEALDILSDKVSTVEKEYETYMKASEALLDEEVEAVFLSAAYKSIIDEELDDFEIKTEILDTIQIKVKNEVENIEADVKNESFNIYISGIDIYGDISLVSRSDVNMIVSVNPKTHKVLLTSIPRDYYVRLHGTSGYKDKLTHAGIYGINMSIQTLQDLFGIDINYYIRVNFTTVINLVDAIGGIDIYSDQAFVSYSNSACRYKLGTNHLDGTCALAFARERYAYLEGDRHRIQNQQDVLKAILNKALSSKTLITKYTSILESLGYSFQTSIPSDKMYELINMQLDKMPNWDIEQISVNGSDSHNYTYSYTGEKLYVMEPDMSTVEAAKEKIKEIEKGI